MPNFTSKYAIPRQLTSDPIAQGPITMAAMADRMDLLLGESGKFTTSAAANTTTTNNIVLARTYPGNVGAAVPGRVWVSLEQTTFGVLSFLWWVGNWAGTASTVTGFGISHRWDTAQAGRVVTWHFLPYL